MAIRRGESWGEAVARPAGLRVASTDAELAALLTDGTGHPTAASGGDLHRTVGGRPVGARSDLLALPVDLLSVSLDGGEPLPAVAHVVARSPWWRGSWWLGEVLVVMNAEYLGRFDVAPRGHPNDGRCEVLHVTQMAVRQRWALRRRLPNASHLPHPDVRTRSVRAAEWSFRRPRRIVIDGVDAGAARHLSVVVEADAATLYA